jgi:alkylhydroperoxidase family enzyme
VRASGNDALVQAVLDDWRTAPVEPRLRAALAFVEKLTLDPANIGPADMGPLRAQGITDDGIEDAMHACVLFNVYDRLADSLAFEIPDEHGFAMSAKMLLKRGYL